MSLVRSLFVLTKAEVDCAFAHAKTAGYFHGLKLLQAPASCSGQTEQGKLLIMIPKAAGKAHDRNRIRRCVKAIFYGDKLYKIPATWILLVQKKGVALDFDQLRNFFMSAMNSAAAQSTIQANNQSRSS